MAFSRRELFQLLPRSTADVSRAMSHPARVKILMLLVQQGETSFAQLVKLLPLHRTTISQHLRLLLRHELVMVREVVPHTYYSVNGLKVSDLLFVLRQFCDYMEEH